MGLPTLVLIDLQKDFYSPGGAYARAGRPLYPIQSIIEDLIPFAESYPRVVRMRSIYRKHQFSDMPRLCLENAMGSRWHPDLAKGPLLTKRTHSGFSILKKHFHEPTPIVLGGVCTHRCVRETFRQARAHGWEVSILEDGVASCGKRWSRHKNCLRRWRRKNQTIQMAQLRKQFQDHFSNKQQKNVRNGVASAF